jgi:hypothetical protein
MIRDVHPGSRILDPDIFSSRIQGLIKHRSQIPDTQYCFIFTAGKLYTVRYLPYCHIIYLNNSMFFIWSSISSKIFLRKSIEIC